MYIDQSFMKIFSILTFLYPTAKGQNCNNLSCSGETCTVKFNPVVVPTKVPQTKLPTKYDSKGLQPFFNLANSFMNTVQSKRFDEHFKDCKYIICWNSLSYFWPMFPFYTPWKHQKTRGFTVFSGSIKWEHWPEMGEASKEYCGDCVDHYYSILFGEQKRSFLYSSCDWYLIISRENFRKPSLLVF